MNREIKFRAWDTHIKRMVGWYDCVFINLNKDGKNTTTTMLCEYPLRYINDESNFFNYIQYTGLKDKNGNEVYEGDILESSGIILPITVDDFHGYRFMYGKDYLCKAYAYYGEVIGNIYENPELLK